MSDLDLEDRILWRTIYHGSSSEIEVVALALTAELRRERRRVATLEDAIDDAPHAQGCARGVIAYSGRIDRFGTFPACDCWKADVHDVSRPSVAEMAGSFEGGPDSVEWLRKQRADEEADR